MPDTFDAKTNTVNAPSPATDTAPVDIPSNLAPPSSGNVLASTQPAPASSPAPQPAQPQVHPAAAKQIVKHALLGRLAHSLFNDEDINYSVDRTGQTVVTRTPQKPGALFKRILVGALLGGAAAEQGPKNAGFLGGMAEGGAAEIGHLNEEDLRKREQAQKQFENQQSVDRADQEKILHAAQIAQMTAITIATEQNSSLHSLEFLTANNDKNNTLRIMLAEKNIKPYPIIYNGQDVNGVVGNGKQLMKHGTVDINNLKAPEGSHALPLVDYDFAGLHQEGAKWLDEKNNVVDPTTRTRVTLYAVPESIWNEQIRMSEKDLNTLGNAKFFKEDGDKTHALTVGDALALRGKGDIDAGQKAKDDLELKVGRLKVAEATAQAKKAGNEATAVDRKAWLAVYEESRTIINERRKEISQKQANFEDTTADEKKVKEYEDDMKTLREKIYPQTKVTPNPAPNPQNGQPNPNASPQIQPGHVVTLKSGQTVTVTKVYANGTFDYK